MTIQLRTLGSIDLAADDRPGVAAVLEQPKRFALLTYLAVAAAGGWARRDTLLALFWPETDQTRGRNVLRQTVFRLRQSLGSQAIRSRGDEELRVDAHAVECDVPQFEALLAAGRTDEALQLYRGDFLTGFHVPDAAPEFDEWMESERRRLRALATNAAWSLAISEEQAGRGDRAVTWARRALALDPLNEKRVTDAMQLFARTGDRAAALGAYRDYARRAEADLGIEPDGSMRRVADALRVTPEGSYAPSAPIIDARSAESPAPVSVPAHVEPVERVTAPARARRWKRHAWRVGLPVAVCLVIGIVLLRGPEAKMPEPAEGNVHVTTSSVIAYRLYDQAMQANYANDKPAAYRLFLAALEEDSLFASAAYYAGDIAYNTARQQESDMLLARAERLAGRTADRERLFILHRVAGLRMSPAAFAYADTLATRYPFDPEAQYARGMEAASSGDFTRAITQFRRVIALDSLSLRGAARCLACDAYTQAFWAYILADSFPAAERIAREFSTARPDDAYPPALLARVLVRLGRYEEAWAEAQKIELRGGSINADHARALDAIRNGDFREADERLGRLMLEGNPAMREEAAWFLVLSLRNQGRYADALSVASRSPPPSHAIVLFESGRAGEAARAFERMARAIADGAPPGHRARHQAWHYTHVASSAAAAGDTARLQQLAEFVERIGRESGYGRDGRLHHYIRGLLWNARGQPQRAADAFTQSVYAWTDGFTRANYELAKTALALRQPERAVYPLQAALRGDLQSSNLYVTRTELHELLAQAFDQSAQPDSAARHYAAVLSAWQRADQPLQERRRVAQQRYDVLTRATTPPR